jgi:hypothetical protein
MATPLKYILIGDTNTVQIIAEFVIVKNPQTQTESKQIFEKLSKSSDKKIDQRNKIQGKLGNYYFTITSPNIFFLILVESTYQERFVFQLIDEINKDHIPLMVNDKNELNASGRQMLKSLVDKYQDERNINKISTIQSDVEDIKVDMNKGIRSMVTNIADIKNLEDQSNRIKVTSADYNKNAKELERVTWWQNCKLTIIIAALVIGVALAIILPLVLK